MPAEVSPPATFGGISRILGGVAIGICGGRAAGNGFALNTLAEKWTTVSRGAANDTTKIQIMTLPNFSIKSRRSKLAQFWCRRYTPSLWER